MSSSEASQCMLAQKWEESIDPTGYWMSEKLVSILHYIHFNMYFIKSKNILTTSL